MRGTVCRWICPLALRTITRFPNICPGTAMALGELVQWRRVLAGFSGPRRIDRSTDGICPWIPFPRLFPRPFPRQFHAHFYPPFPISTVRRQIASRPSDAARAAGDGLIVTSLLRDARLAGRCRRLAAHASIVCLSVCCTKQSATMHPMCNANCPNWPTYLAGLHRKARPRLGLE